MCNAELTTFQEQRAYRDNLRELSGKIISSKRVKSCGKVPAPAGAAIHWRGNHAGYHGLMRCGNVWTCPNCGAIIAQRRSEEVNRGLRHAFILGHHASMLTLTARHTRADSLKTLLEKMNKAIRYMYNGRKWQALAEDIGYVGSIRNAEATFGEGTGWHPHSHVVLLTKGELTERMDMEIFRRWQESCKKVGLETSWEAWHTTRDEIARSESVQELEDSVFSLAEYVTGAEKEWGSVKPNKTARWTAGDELSKWHRKRSGQERYSPAGLLQAIDEGQQHLVPIYEEYARAYKGKRQLFWSHGLKKELLVDIKSDAELLEESTKGEVIHEFTREEWQLVKQYDYRMILLEATEYADPEKRPEAVIRELDLLKNKYTKEKDQVDYTIDLRLVEKAFSKLFMTASRETPPVKQKTGLGFLKRCAFFDDVPPTQQLTAKERRRRRERYA